MYNVWCDNIRLSPLKTGYPRIAPGRVKSTHIFIISCVFVCLVAGFEGREIGVDLFRGYYYDGG